MKLVSVLTVFVAFDFSKASQSLNQRVNHLENQLKDILKTHGTNQNTNSISQLKNEELEAYKAENERLKLALTNAAMVCSASLVNDSHCPDNMVGLKVMNIVISILIRLFL